MAVFLPKSGRLGSVTLPPPAPQRAWNKPANGEAPSSQPVHPLCSVNEGTKTQGPGLALSDKGRWESWS